MAEGRTLVFSFDGTGNEPSNGGRFRKDESISNVFKLHVMMGGRLGSQTGEDISRTTTAEGREQRTHYYSGIGTRTGKLRMPLLADIVNKVVAPSFGDARRILRDAREDFEAAGYRPEDKIVIFGYSRGAALARQFASKILQEHEQCRVSFLGVFDTVAAMNGIHRRWNKISSDVLFENCTLSPRIERAVHLVSLDENRTAFTPTLINKDAEDSRRILEVWFPGMHGDVGGGYWFDGLSDVALRFMIDECRRSLGDEVSIVQGIEGLGGALQDLGADAPDLSVDDFYMHPMPHGVMHETPGTWKVVTGLAERSVHVSAGDRPSPGDVPILHHSVKRRFDAVIGYRPHALRGLTFRLLLPLTEERAGERAGDVGSGQHELSAEICGISGLRAHPRLPGPR